MYEKTTTLDLELAVMRYFDIRKNLIVPGITEMSNLVSFELDMIVITKANMAYGFELKNTKADLKKDFSKGQLKEIDEVWNGKTGLERYYGKFKHFYYVVPRLIKDDALALVPDMFGVFVVDKMKGGVVRFYDARPAKKLFNYKWSDEEKYAVARLGAMRIYGLKRKIELILERNRVSGTF